MLPMPGSPNFWSDCRLRSGDLEGSCSGAGRRPSGRQRCPRGATKTALRGDLGVPQSPSIRAAGPGWQANRGTDPRHSPLPILLMPCQLRLCRHHLAAAARRPPGPPGRPDACQAGLTSSRRKSFAGLGHTLGPLRLRAALGPEFNQASVAHCLACGVSGRRR